jgi:hypothetical protein
LRFADTEAPARLNTLADIMRGGRGTDTDMNPDAADRVFGMP